MIKIKEINHINATTGDLYIARSEDIDKRLLFALNAICKAAQTSGGVEFLGVKFKMVVEADGTYAGTFYLDNGVPFLITCGTKSSQRRKNLWDGLQKNFQVGSDSSKVCTIPPAVPYCADLIIRTTEENMRKAQEYLQWVPGFTGLLAWIVLYPKLLV